VKDERGEILTFEENENWTYFLDEFRLCMNRNEKGGVLSEEGEDEPVRPDEAFQRRIHGPPYPNDDRVILEYIKAMRSWKPMCEVVLAALKSSLGTKVMTYLRLTVDQMGLGTRQNILHIIEVIRLKYGTWTSARGNKNYMAMLAIPTFTSETLAYSGLWTMRKLRAQRQGWNDIAQLYPDNYYRTWIISMLEWDELNYIKNVISRDEDLSYNDCQVEILATLEILNDAKNQKLSRMKEKLDNFGAMSATDNSGILDSANYFGNSASMEQRIAANVTQQLMANIGSGGNMGHSANFTQRKFQRGNTGKMTKCFNCQMNGHIARECNELWCSKCQKYFKSMQDPSYHRNTDCPTWMSLAVDNGTSSVLGKRLYAPGATGNTGAQSRQSQKPTPSAQPGIRATWPPRGQGQMRNYGQPSMQQPRNQGQPIMSTASSYKANVMLESTLDMENPDELLEMAERLKAHAIRLSEHVDADPEKEPICSDYIPDWDDEEQC